MTSVLEAAGVQSELAAGLRTGVNTLSSDQTITFTLYRRLVLPLDGSVFWVRSDLTAGKLTEVSVKGSLHYATNQRQDENEGYAVNRVVFTAESEIQDLNEVGPDTLFIGVIDSIRFAFSQRQSFYQQADLFHYVGDAVYPAMATQLIDDVNQLLNRDLVVSNSLPVWLALNQIITAYPSYLVPDNIEPPYASIHIDPTGTSALQSVARIDDASSHWQLATDKVRVTLYGLRNSDALNYLDAVIKFMTERDDVMGLMNTPLIRDEKKTQAEMSVLAIKKTVEFQVSYYQSAVRTIARQYILSCIPTYIVTDTP